MSCKFLSSCKISSGDGKLSWHLSSELMPFSKLRAYPKNSPVSQELLIPDLHFSVKKLKDAKMYLISKPSSLVKKVYGRERSILL